MKNFLMNEIENDGIASAGGSTGTQAKPKSPKPPANPPNEESGDDFDDFGYPKEAAAPAEGAPDKAGQKPDKQVAATGGDDKVETPATGYDEAPEEIKDETPAPVPKVEPVDSTDSELGFELKLDKILPKEESSRLKEFAKKHGLTKEAAQELLDQRAGEFKQFEQGKTELQKQQELAVKKQRAAWYNELKADPDFGGEKFGVNVQRVDKLVDQFLPGTKKALTERGSMLPPYVMRDLAKLADHLYSSEKFSSGSPAVGDQKEKDEESDDPLSFYT